MMFHDVNRGADDIKDAASPAAMHVGNHMPKGLVHKNRLTIRYLNHQEFFLDIGDDGVTDNWRRALGVCFSAMSTGQTEYSLAVNLFGKYKICSPDALRNEVPVLLNMRFLIPNAFADIQTMVGRVTIAGVSRKNPMVDRRIGRQMMKLIIPYFVFSSSDHTGNTPDLAQVLIGTKFSAGRRHSAVSGQDPLNDPAGGGIRFNGNPHDFAAD
jgi:hypothetical protein